jgi:hypothetical protein
LITNLFKLVRSSDLAAQHAPSVLPGIERIIESAAFLGEGVRALASVLLGELHELRKGGLFVAERLGEVVLPGIERIIESAAFPEIRAFAEEAKRAVDKSCVGERAARWRRRRT